MNIGLIVDENPISRSYINVLKEANVSFKYLIILNPKSIFPNFISLRLNFNKNNYWPLKFLKQKDYLYLCHQVEDFFNFSLAISKPSSIFLLIKKELTPR